jgi:hypothetical protein
MTTDNPIHDRKRRCVSLFHRRIANPITRRLPTQVLLETTGRVSGQLRRTLSAAGATPRRSGSCPITAKRQNIKMDNRVRVRIRADGTREQRLCCPAMTLMHA